MHPWKLFKNEYFAPFSLFELHPRYRNTVIKELSQLKNAPAKTDVLGLGSSTQWCYLVSLYGFAFEGFILTGKLSHRLLQNDPKKNAHHSLENAG